MQKLCNDASCWIGGLCRGPYRCTLGLNVGHRTRCTYGPMHLVGIGVFCPNNTGRGGELRVSVPGVNAENVASRLLLEIVEEVALQRELRPGIPADRQLTGRQCRPVLRFGDDAHKIL